MSNPNNAFGTNAAFGGRTSPKAFNDVLGAFQGRGILSGWTCSPNSGMSVVLGGDGNTRDVALAENNTGDKITVNNISGSPIPVNIEAAPSTQSRIDAVVAYIENPPQGSATATDNYGAVSVIDVAGDVSNSPIKPDDSAIRSAITADGASGSTAYYVVLAYITIDAGTTDITTNIIEQGPSTALQSALANIPDDTITTPMVQDEAITSDKIDWSTLMTTYGSGNNICYKFANGLQIAVQRVSGTANSSGNWANNTYTADNVVDFPEFANPFLATPMCAISNEMTASNYWIVTGNRAATAARPANYSLCRPNNASIKFIVTLIAIGMA